MTYIVFNYILRFNLKSKRIWLFISYCHLFATLAFIQYHIHNLNRLSLCGLRLKSMFFAPIVSLLRFLFWFFSFIRCYFPLLIHSCSYFNRQFCRFSPVQFLFYALIASLLFVFSKKKESTFKRYEKCNKKNWKCVCVSINMYMWMVDNRWVERTLCVL